MKMLRAGDLRHYVNVLLGPDATDDHGQAVGLDTVYIKDVPCSIETLSGRESEIARQQYAEATHLVKCYGDPARPIREHMRLRFGARLIEIGFVKDVNQNGEVLELLCGEVVGG